jgi:hypothetical protein
LKEFKQGDVELVKVTPGAGPVNDPGAPSSNTYILNATVKGVGFKHIDGSTVVSSDLEVTASITVTNKITGVKSKQRFSLADHILIDGRRHNIQRDLSKPSAGNPVVLKAAVRAA